MYANTTDEAKTIFLLFDAHRADNCDDFDVGIRYTTSAVNTSDETQWGPLKSIYLQSGDTA